MEALLKKLNFKPGSRVFLGNIPDEWQALSDCFRAEGILFIEPVLDKTIDFALVFVKEQAQIAAVLDWLPTQMPGDACLWFAYPKATAKKYHCDFNRDTGWEALGKAGFEGVRQVAIDEEWSALRFRRVEFIQKMTRQKTRALTQAGKAKTQTED
ncbi:MAG: hypothetical protein HC913_04415 [Microscillaceae bacterium]|nr:hypothetical protein [Microscillaceae bacterium]